MTGHPLLKSQTSSHTGRATTSMACAGRSPKKTKMEPTEGPLEKERNLQRETNG